MSRAREEAGQAGILAVLAILHLHSNLELFVVGRHHQTSVKTDFSLAEPPANYPANPLAGDFWPTNPDIRLLPNIR